MSDALTAHRIDRAEVTIAMSGRADSIDAERLRKWTKGVLLEEFDRAASELCPDDRCVSIGELRIEVELSAQEFDSDAVAVRLGIREALLRQLRDRVSGRQSTTMAGFLHLVAFDYLRSGVLSPSRTKDTLKAALSRILLDMADEEAVRAALFEVLAQPTAYERFRTHAGDAELYKLLAYETGRSAEAWSRFISKLPGILRRYASVFRPASAAELLRLLFVTHPSSVPESGELLRDMLHRLINALKVSEAESGSTPSNRITNAEIRDDIEEAIRTSGLALERASIDEMLDPAAMQQPAIESADTTESDVPLPPDMRVQNAGLVLLAPFLQSFLSSIDALNRDGTPVQPARLPMLLHYLATGELTAEEWQLLLPKLLAGLRATDICHTEISVNEEEVLKAGELLNSVIELWERLQGTSIGGLRETFLQRAGTLSGESGRWKLRVREESVDILLQFVPWPFHTIRLPWMDGILFVDW